MKDGNLNEKCESYKRQLGGMTASRNMLKQELKECQKDLRNSERQLSKMKYFAEECWKELRAIGRDEVFSYDFLNGMAHELGLEQR